MEKDVQNLVTTLQTTEEGMKQWVKDVEEWAALSMCFFCFFSFFFFCPSPIAIKFQLSDLTSKGIGLIDNCVFTLRSQVQQLPGPTGTAAGHGGARP